MAEERGNVEVEGGQVHRANSQPRTLVLSTSLQLNSHLSFLLHGKELRLCLKGPHSLSSRACPLYDTKTVREGEKHYLMQPVRIHIYPSPGTCTHTCEPWSPSISTRCVLLVQRSSVLKSVSKHRAFWRRM